MLGLMVEHPLLALIPAVLFLGIAAFARSRAAFAAAGLWALYFVWELGMKARVLCSGECNIRIDLLLIYPTLAIVSVAALVMSARRLRGVNSSKG